MSATHTTTLPERLEKLASKVDTINDPDAPWVHPSEVRDALRHAATVIRNLHRQLAKGYGDTSWIDEYPDKEDSSG